MTKFYLEIDDQPPFCVEAPSQHHAILKYWQTLTEKVRAVPAESIQYLDPASIGFEPEYKLHFGQAEDAIVVGSSQAFLLAPQPIQFLVQWAIAAVYGPEGLELFFEELANPELKSRVRCFHADGSYTDKLV